MEIIKNIIKDFDLAYLEGTYIISYDKDIIPIIKILCENNFKICLAIDDVSINIKNTPIVFYYNEDVKTEKFYDVSPYKIYKVYSCLDNKIHKFIFGQIYIADSTIIRKNFTGHIDILCEDYTYFVGREEFETLRDAKIYFKNDKKLKYTKHYINNIDQLQNYNGEHEYIVINEFDMDEVDISNIFNNPKLIKLHLLLSSFTFDINSIKNNLSITKFKCPSYSLEYLNINSLEITEILFRNIHRKKNIKSSNNFLMI